MNDTLTALSLKAAGPFRFDPMGVRPDDQYRQYPFPPDRHGAVAIAVDIGIAQTSYAPGLEERTSQENFAASASTG